MLKNMITSLQAFPDEEAQLLKFVLSLGAASGQKILDIGCGYCEKSKILRSHGFEVRGVDVNPHIVKVNQEAGLDCVTVSEFEMTAELYDVLILSHVIEHFSPGDLLGFMEKYLNRLKPGGYVIIATPLNSPFFYDDFDHVRPYQPVGLNMVFGANTAQVQYYSKNKLGLVDIWFRRGPFIMVYARGLYVRTRCKVPLIINLAFKILFRISFGIIGRTDGWMGLYRKK